MHKFLFIPPYFRHWRNFITAQLYLIMFILILFYITQVTFDILYRYWTYVLFLGIMIWIITEILSISLFNRSRYLILFETHLEIIMNKMKIDIDYNNILLVAKVIREKAKQNNKFVIEARGINS